MDCGTSPSQSYGPRVSLPPSAALLAYFLFYQRSRLAFCCNFCGKMKFLVRIFFFPWPFFPEALQAQRVRAMTVLPLLAALPLVIALSFPLFILLENRMEFTPPALLHNSTFVHRTQSFTFIKCAQTEMRSACCVSIPWLTMRGAGCFHKCPK